MASTVSTPLNDALGLPRITPQAASQGVYMGSRYTYQAGSQAPVTREDTFVPTGDVWGAYASLSPEASKTLVQIMNAKAGKRSWNPEELKGLFSDGVLASNYIVSQTGEAVDPIEALARFYLDGQEVPGMGQRDAGGGAGAGAGGAGGGGYSGPITQTRLTDTVTAESLLDKSLKDYLGRAATDKEKSAFVKSLNRYEAENPTVTTPTGPGGSVTTGGAQPSVFAEQYARGQEGAAEYGAATTYFDAFLGALKNPVG